MNRIVLIGNGFDLAHDLKTSYKHFIDHLWSEIISEINSKALFEPFKNDLLNITQNLNFCKNRKDYSELKSALNHVKTKYEFKNDFFRTISEKHYLNNWVDIENEYYSQLKQHVNDPRKDISKLNSDFEAIISLLKTYLTEINNGSTEKYQTIQDHLNSPSKGNNLNESYIEERVQIEFEKFKRIENIILTKENKDLLEDGDTQFYERFRGTNPLSYIRTELKSANAWAYFDMFPKELLLLNFNYTNTHSLYTNIHFNERLDTIKPITTSLQIHGELDDKKKNPIIFGFGDELDDDYKSIEKLNNNDFLEHIKSMKYLETGNYKKLLEFINSDNYEVFIFGHSCGVSDRTLLNALFENDNCISIKPFYYKEEDGKDNFNDIIKNISRNFNNKVSMRDKVVNKTNCVPLK